MRLSLACCCLLISACGSSAKNGNDMAMVVTDMTVPNIDAGPSECNGLTNTGCPSGDKCTIGTDHGAPREICFPIAASPVAEGGDCMSVTMGERVGDNCAAALDCVNYAGEGAKCRRPCYLRADCAAGNACVVLTVSNTTFTPDGGFPLPLSTCHSDDGCDPVAQGKCTGGKGCYLSRPDDVGRVGVCLTPSSTKMDGEACNRTVPGCAPGFRCDEFSICRRYCYYQTPTGAPPTTGQCPANEGTCELFPGSNDTYGICGAL
jgi:hypothetical protein